uniref:WRKY transcription factor protein 24 n=1 Tax=Zanthoxylum armatum TaxID=67938 RepID=A0A8F1NP37_9ROSI|nr:WRKY transcription factor protein 24 [Zanthoxylum armatum]
MGTVCFEKISREKMVKELLKGKKFANQLQVLLQKPFEEDGLVSAEVLVVKILRSFTQTLSEVSSSSRSSDDLDQNLQQKENCCNVDSNGHRRSADSGESEKRLLGLKDKRGGYKRKKNSQTWAIVSSTIEDGHAWRKYGQKEIRNAKYPRSYFRCTHKYVQGCWATKQAQRREDDPQKYEITYIGHHTCRDMIRFSQILTENSDLKWSSTAAVAAAASSHYKEVTASTYQDLSDNLSSLDSIVWENFVPLQSSDEPEAAADMVLPYKKITCSHHSLDMYNDFEHFDECQFF